MRGKIFSIPAKEGRPVNYAFIKGEDGKDHFLHTSELFDTWDQLKWQLSQVKDGVDIEFETTQGEKGSRAVGAKLLGVTGE